MLPNTWAFAEQGPLGRASTTLAPLLCSPRLGLCMKLEFTVLLEASPCASFFAGL